MRFQAGIQILLLVIAMVIAFSVIKPKIAAISADQSEVASYRAAIENIGRYNQQLQALINQANSLSAYDRSVLWRYLPEEIDATLVSSDIANIVSQNRLLLLDIVPSELSLVTAETEDPNMPGDVAVAPVDPTGVVIEGEAGMPKGLLVSQQFQVEVVGTYEQMKAMMRDFERNAYPLKLVNFEFNLEEEGSGLVQYSLLLETYALSAR